MVPKHHNTIIIGFCDISAAGCRALLGCSNDMVKLVLQRKIEDLESFKSQIDNEEAGMPVFCKAECNSGNATLVSVSSRLSPGAASHFFEEIFNEIRSSKINEVVVVAAVPIKMNSVKDTDVFQVAINCEKVQDIKSFPDSFLMKDFMVNMAIQLGQVENISMRCFVTRGYRIGSGKPNHLDGSLQSIGNLQGGLNSFYGLNFDEEKTQSLVYHEKIEELQPQNVMFL